MQPVRLPGPLFDNVTDLSEGNPIAVSSSGSTLLLRIFPLHADYDTIIGPEILSVFTIKLDAQTGNPLWIRNGGGPPMMKDRGLHSIRWITYSLRYYKSYATSIGNVSNFNYTDIYLISIILPEIFFGQGAPTDGHDEATK